MTTTAQNVIIISTREILKSKRDRVLDKNPVSLDFQNSQQFQESEDVMRFYKHFSVFVVK